PAYLAMPGTGNVRFLPFLWHAFLAPCATRPPNRNGAKRTLLLTGIAKCGVCEKTVLGKGRTYKGEWRRAYSCPQGHVSRSVPFVDNIVSRRACAVLSRPEIVSARSEEHTSELQSRFDLVCR